MKRVAFKMKLKPGFEDEYKQRHEAIWPDLTVLLKNTGIYDYAIFLDKESLDLFGVLKIADESLQATLPQQPVMQKWWAYMGDIMETNPDSSPVSVQLNEVFYME